MLHPPWTSTSVESAKYWQSKLEHAAASPVPSLIAEIQGKAVGFIIGSSSAWEYGVPENVGWIDTIGVLPEYQNKYHAARGTRE